jgi:hypothetical protein
VTRSKGAGEEAEEVEEVEEVQIAEGYVDEKLKIGDGRVRLLEILEEEAIHSEEGGIAWIRFWLADWLAGWGGWMRDEG